MSTATAAAPELPHVTAVIKAAGLMGDMSFVPAEAIALGSAVHAATEYADEGDLDRESLHPRVAARLTHWERFRAETDVEILAVEMSVVNDMLGYCGTLDRLVRINGREGVLDIKGVMRAPWVGVQLAAYAGCFERRLERWSLHLTDDEYRLIHHTDRDDWRVFQAALTVANFRRAHGLLPDREERA